MNIRIQKRTSGKPHPAILMWCLSVLLASVGGSIMFLVVGLQPLTVYATILKGSIGSTYAISEVIVKSIPLITCGLAVAVASRGGLWNIGAEGQWAMGAVFATGTALFIVPYAPTIFHIPLVLAAGACGGAFWGFIPGILKAKFGVNEILVTIFLNTIAIETAKFFYYGSWRDPKSFGFPGTAMIPTTTWLPQISGRVHTGLIGALVIMIVVWFIFAFAKWGFEVLLVGENRTAAFNVGIPTVWIITSTFMVSGAIAGLAGTFEVVGVMHKLQDGFVLGYGFTAIIITWIAKHNPLGIVFVSIVFAGLFVGNDHAQMILGLPSSIALLLQGMLLFGLISSELLNRYEITREMSEPTLTGGAK